MIPVGIERQGQGRKDIRPQQGRKLHRGDPAQITGEDARRDRREVGRPAQKKDLAVKQSRPWRQRQIGRQCRSCRPTIRPDHLTRHGNGFRGGRRGAACQRMIPNKARPREVVKDGVSIAQVVGPDRFISSQGDRALKFRYRADCGETMVASEPSLACRAHESPQSSFLNPDRIGVDDRVPAEPRIEVEPHVHGLAYRRRTKQLLQSPDCSRSNAHACGRSIFARRQK